jgi:flagellar biosynthesis/type III secretory pathway M-ring protein FliF/YscJ
MGVLLQNILDGDNSRWVMIGMAALTILYVVVRPMLRRKKDPLERAPKMGLSQQRTVEREMSHVLVELSDMARQISAQLDTRAARLEVLIQQADERLEALSARVDSPPAAAAGSQQRRPVDPPPAPPDPHHLEV